MELVFSIVELLLHPLAMLLCTSPNAGPENHISKPRDYWAEASDQLQNIRVDLFRQLGSALGVLPNDPKALQERIAEILTANLKRILDRQWRIKWRARNVPVRRLLDGVIKCLQSLKDVGSTAAGLDPLHPGLPWAVVCVLLPLALNFSNQEEAAKTGLDKMASAVARYSEMERIYLSERETGLTDTMSICVVELYTKILEYQAVAVCFFRKRTLTRFARAIPKLDDFLGLYQEVIAKDNSCKEIAATLDARMQRTHGTQLHKILEGTGQLLGMVQLQIDQNEKITR